MASNLLGVVPLFTVATRPIVKDSPTSVSGGVTYTAGNNLNIRWDPDDSGPGYISGTVRIGGVPVSRLVRLLEHKSARIVDEVVSASDGTYRFSLLRTDMAYDIIGVDNAGVYNSVIATSIFATI